MLEHATDKMLTKQRHAKSNRSCARGITLYEAWKIDHPCWRWKTYNGQVDVHPKCELGRFQRRLHDERLRSGSTTSVQMLLPPSLLTTLLFNLLPAGQKAIDSGSRQREIRGVCWGGAFLGLGYERREHVISIDGEPVHAWHIGLRFGIFRQSLDKGRTVEVGVFVSKNTYYAPEEESLAFRARCKAHRRELSGAGRGGRRGCAGCGSRNIVGHVSKLTSGDRREGNRA